MFNLFNLIVEWTTIGLGFIFMIIFLAGPFILLIISARHNANNQPEWIQLMRPWAWLSFAWACGMLVIHGLCAIYMRDPIKEIKEGFMHVFAWVVAYGIFRSYDHYRAYCRYRDRNKGNYTS